MWKGIVHTLRLTSVSDLAGIAAGSGGSPLGECDPDLAQALGGGARPDTFVPGQKDLLEIAIRPLDLGLDRHNLVVEPALLLRLLGALETLGGILIHLFPPDTEVPADVLARPAHGLHSVCGLLALGGHGLVEWLIEPVATYRHGLGTDGDSNLDVTGGNGIGNVGGGLEAGRAKSIYRVGPGCVGEAGGEGGGTKFVGCFPVGDLKQTQRGYWSAVSPAKYSHPRGGRVGWAYISETDVLDKCRVYGTTVLDLLQQGIDNILKARILEAALLRLGERCPDGEGNDYVVGILGGAVEEGALMISRRSSDSLLLAARRRLTWRQVGFRESGA